MYKRFSLLLTCILSTFYVTASGESDWLTDCEKSGFRETPRYEQTIAFCKRLAEHSQLAEYTSFGVTPQGRELPLLIIDGNAEFDAQGEHTQKKVVVLIQAGIHPGEIEGKDAGLMFFRDMLVHGKYSALLDSVVILFVPIFNVDGHERFGPYNRINQNGPEEMGWRTTAHNLNLNRDFVKADAPETQSWLGLFNDWLPDMLADIHTTDGADYQYVITYDLQVHKGMAKSLQDWTRDKLVPDLKSRFKESGLDLFPYVAPRVGHDIRTGVQSGPYPPRLSNGYGAIQNRPFMLIETHMLKPYKQRVEATYEFFRHFLNFAHDNNSAVRALVEKSDRETASLSPGTYIALNFEQAKDSTMIDFKGVEFHFEHSDISDTDMIVWGDTPRTYTIPWFNQSFVSDSAAIPYAYLIPQEWSEVIDRMEIHGVRVDRLSQATTLPVSSYTLRSPEFAIRPYEGRQSVNFVTSLSNDTITFPEGTAVVVMNQRTNRVIAHALEPRSTDSFVRWGFFNAIFEQKEYAEGYGLEKLAREMLAGDSTLASDFRSKLLTDSSFAHNPQARLEFFYQKSPFWDARIGSYPVKKLMNKVELNLK